VDGISTADLDELSTANSASLTNRDPEYGILASRIAISNLHKMTPAKFSECTNVQYRHVHPKTGGHSPLISDMHHKMIMEHADKYDAMIHAERDYQHDYFAYKTLEKVISESRRSTPAGI
jgi:ribonucleotide reductase alpha subunit